MDAYPPYFRKLYRASEAAGLGLTFADFAGMLWEMGGRAPDRAVYSNLHLQDLALAQACARGLAPAWEEFCRRFRSRLYAAAMTIARNESVARELTDSLFGEIWPSKLASYTGRGSLDGWLKAVLAQSYVDRYRCCRRAVSLEERLSTIQQVCVSDIAEVVVDPRLNQAINAAWLSLPPDNRYLLASYFFDQRTLAGIAKTLAVHESTVSRRIDRLIQLLRKRIIHILRDKGMTVRQIEESFETDVRELALDWLVRE